MFKNGVIAILGSLLILQHPAYTAHRNTLVFFAMAAVLFVTVSILENEVHKYKRAKNYRRRFRKQMENIHLQEGESA